MRSRFDPGAALPPGKAVASTAAPRACVRVAILSDVRLVRDGLQRFLADRADLLLAATLPLSMADTEGLAAARPQVILVDVARAEPAAIAARLRLACPGARLVLAPDWQPIVWSEADRKKGQAWGLPTIPSFHTHGTPPVE